ncbi:MAG: hypothetical protein RMY29_027265 [Nostoc sp. CreGUA01]|nr:hypothetical protein [Nostoc sp. CreGUA01]
MGRWGKSNSSFPPSPHPLIPPSSSHAQCPMPNAQYHLLTWRQDYSLNFQIEAIAPESRQHSEVS